MQNFVLQDGVDPKKWFKKWLDMIKNYLEQCLAGDLPSGSKISAEGLWRLYPNLIEQLYF